MLVNTISQEEMDFFSFNNWALKMLGSQYYGPCAKDMFEQANGYTKDFATTKLQTHANQIRVT